MSDVIYNETGIGDLKGKTPNYNFNIPYFDIATWHDYIEENFRSIDALFHYIYEIKQYKGKWENNTTYNVDDVLFIVDDNSEFNGRLVKVLLEHTTSDKTFDEFYAEHNEYYELFLDATAAHEFAVEAKSSSEIAKEAEENCQMYSESAFNSMQQANNSATQSQNSENSAYNYQEIAKNSAKIARDSAKISQLSSIILTNINVNTKDWNKTENYPNVSGLIIQTYPYYKTILSTFNKNLANLPDDVEFNSVSGVVMFNPNEVISGEYAPFANVSVYNDLDPNFYKIYTTIFSKNIPTQEFILPRVIAYVKGVIKNDS